MHRKICYYLDEVSRILQGQTQYPVSCEIDLSNHCQNRCSFCMFKDYLNTSRVNLNYDIYQKIIHELKQLGTESITFTGGGEPTTHPKFREAVLEARELRFEVGLVTNGIELDTYIDLVPMFRFVRVSLDAATQSTYSTIKGQPMFERVINNIKSAVEARPPFRNGETTIAISFVVCEENQHEVEQAKALARKMKVDYLQFKPAFRRELGKIRGDSKAFTTERYEVDSNLPCAIAGLVGIIGADANVYYCCQKRGEDKYCLGNLKTGTLKQMWTQRNSVNPDLSECFTCRYMNYAKGYRRFSKSKYQYLRHKHFL